LTEEEPTFEEYEIARRVMFYVREDLERKGKRINIASAELVAEIVSRSCRRYYRPVETPLTVINLKP